MKLELSTTASPMTNINKVKQACAVVYSDLPIVGELAVCQAILESRLSGVPSELALKGNNLFGIKGFGTAGSIYFSTKEYIHGKETTVTAGFAKNNTLDDSIKQHRHLLESGVSWNRELYKPVLNSKTFAEAAREIQECGYATDPNYTQLLLEIHKKYFG